MVVCRCTLNSSGLVAAKASIATITTTSTIRIVLKIAMRNSFLVKSTCKQQKTITHQLGFFQESKMQLSLNPDGRNP